MQAAKFAVAGAIALAAGCASGPDTTAQAQCQYFAREEGLEFVRIVNVAAGADATNVEMQVKDGLGRSFNATCVSAAGKKLAWLQPLPSNTMRRWEGDTIGGARPATGAPPAR
jgi:hypothetical protein